MPALPSLLDNTEKSKNPKYLNKRDGLTNPESHNILDGNDTHLSELLFAAPQRQ